MKVKMTCSNTKYGHEIYSEQELTEMGLEILKRIQNAMAMGSWNVRWHGGLWLDDEHYVRYNTLRKKNVVQEIIIEYTNRG